MAKVQPLNGWTRTVATIVGLVMLVSAGVSAHKISVHRIGQNEVAISKQAGRLRYMEFILLRLADKQGVDVSGFK